MQCHYGSQIQNSALSFVKSYQLLKIDDHCNADCISGECFPRLRFSMKLIMCLLDSDHPRLLLRRNTYDIGITIDW